MRLNKIWNVIKCFLFSDEVVAGPGPGPRSRYKRIAGSLNVRDYSVRYCKKHVKGLVCIPNKIRKRFTGAER